MSFKEKVLSIGESFLRVPPLLIVDEIFRISFGFGGKILQHGAKNFVSSGTAVISSSLQPGAADEVNTCSYLYPLNSYLADPSPTCKISESASSSTVSAVRVNASENDAWRSVIRTSVDNLTKSAAAGYHFFLQGKKEDYLLRLPFGDLSSYTESVSYEVARAGEVFGCLLVFFAALIVFLLSTENLLKLYSQFVSFLAVCLVYMIAPFAIFTNGFSVTFLVYGVVVRTVLVSVYFLSRRWSGWESGDKQVSSEAVKRWTSSDLLLLSLFYLCGVVHLQPSVYAVLVLILQRPLWTCIPEAYKLLKNSWNETRRVQNEYGLSHLIQVECSRLRVNTVFRLFWISRAAYDVIFRCCDESVGHMIRYVMSHGTETFTGIVGLTVTVSVICHSIGEFLLWILYWGTNSETDANRFGSISTVLFFILSLQTGLTSLDPEKRLDRLLKNIVLLGTALFHALHQMVAPLLHAFRTFQGLQIRAATISVAFLSISAYSTVYLLQFSTISTWSLAVLALAIEFKIKIVVSLVISVVVYLSQLVQYPEFLQRISNFFRAILPAGIVRVVDKLADQLSHEDVVFYLKSFANVGEFLTGIFLFVNAVWIFMFESASAIRAIGMTIHAYFNIWCEARKGWKIYCQRKTASMKIMSLADATDEQLASRKDDVCAICYEEMESAKVTLCGHLFHAVCLRKWLYVQNTCPLCHELLYGEDVVEEMNRAQGPGAAAAADEAEDEEEDEDEMFEDYPRTNSPGFTPVQVLPQAQVMFTTADAVASSNTEAEIHSGSSPPIESLQSQAQTERHQINQVLESDLPGSAEGHSRISAGGQLEDVVANANMRNNNNNNVNLNGNANSRSRGSLAVLL